MRTLRARGAGHSRKSAVVELATGCRETRPGPYVECDPTLSLQIVDGLIDDRELCHMLVSGAAGKSRSIETFRTDSVRWMVAVRHPRTTPREVGRRDGMRRV